MMAAHAGRSWCMVEQAGVALQSYIDAPGKGVVLEREKKDNCRGQARQYYESSQNKFSWEMFSGDAKQIGGLMAERV